MPQLSCAPLGAVLLFFIMTKRLENYAKRLKDELSPNETEEGISFISSEPLLINFRDYLGSCSVDSSLSGPIIEGVFNDYELIVAESEEAAKVLRDKYIAQLIGQISESENS